MPLRIVIADDHEMYRKGFEVLLRKNPEFIIEAEAENGKHLLEQIAVYKPDLVITDIQMPVMDGVEACREIKRLYPLIPVIALTTYNDDNLIIDMLGAGAEGYLLKSTNKEELIKAIHVVISGGTYFYPETFERVKKMMAENRFNPFKTKEAVIFSERENEIISLTCLGLSSKEVAARLFLSPRTVEGHKNKILEKIEGKSVVDIVVFAIKNKLVTV